MPNKRKKFISMFLGLTLILSNSFIVSAASKDEAVSYSEEYINSYSEYHIERGKIIYLNNKPGKEVILDVDMSTDVDDVCALSIACALDDLGVIKLSAVGMSVQAESDVNIRSIEGTLDSYGKNDIPIGICVGSFVDTSPYWNVLSSYKTSDHQKTNAVSLYRSILANSEDYVDIVTTGFLTNVSALLQSKPDQISPLSGKDLVKQKCGQLYITGGSLTNGYDNNFGFTQEAANAIKYVDENWPLPICYLTNDSGEMTVGGVLQNADTLKKDPTTNALYAFGTDNGRAAWDPFAIYVCAYGSGKNGGIKYRKINTDFYSDGTYAFGDSKDGDHFRACRSLDNSVYENRMESLLLFHLSG